MNQSEGKKRPIAAIVIVAVLIGALIGGGGIWLVMKPGGLTPAGERTGKPKIIYQCPMHPTITSDHPGDCPICGMKLVPMATAPKPAAAAAPAERKIAFYRSPMNPSQTSPVPRQDEMGMPYVPVYEDELQAQSPPVAGMATVTIDPVRQQLIGLRTAKVTRGPVGGSVRTVGTIEVDTRRVKKTNVKVEGFVEKIYVDFVGKPVRRGQPLFSIYSPTLLLAENEYLIALKARAAQPAGDPLGGDALVGAARRKLELLDVTDAEIERIEAEGRAAKTLIVYSPIAGVVTQKTIVQGSSLSPGDAPFEISDLSEVWLLADAYESDLAVVRVGAIATLTLPAYPNHEFAGKVEFIDPILDAATRTVKVRVSFPNPDRALKPGMYGEVVLAGEARDGLRIPFDAVIRSGTMDVVFVALGAGKFSPRQVQLGAKSGELVEVVNGLAEGEEVVVGANFLIDSESRLRASLSALGGD